MKYLARLVALVTVSFLLTSACGKPKSDLSGPDITDISTSGKVLVISDCQADSMTITAKVTDPSTVENVFLWYRVGSDQPFSFIDMEMKNERYAATLKGSAVQGHGYGAMEFYITAEDGEGNTSESQHDESIQFLPCVNS